MSEPPPDRDWLQFTYYGATGLGRERTLDADGHTVIPPRPWRCVLGLHGRTCSRCR